jgi:hypothetical protein
VKEVFLQKLKRYEHLERISLVEQAVWRAVCQMTPKSPKNDTLFWRRWLVEGWKERKEELRNCNAIPIILPFVGNDSST